MREGLPLRIQLYGDEAVLTALTEGNLAEIVTKRGDPEEGRQLAEQAYNVLEAEPGGLSRTGFNIGSKYLVSMVSAGRTDEAILFGTRLLGSADVMLDDNALALPLIKKRLADAHLAAGNSSAALPLYEEAGAWFRDKRGENDLYAMEVVLKLADIDAAKGNVPNAIETYQSFLENFSTIMHRHHPEICRAQLRLGELYLEAGEAETAREYLEQALAAYAESQYPESPLLARAQQSVEALP